MHVGCSVQVSEGEKWHCLEYLVVALDVKSMTTRLFEASIFLANDHCGQR